MITISIVLVKEVDNELLVLQFVPELDVTSDADNLLENARDLAIQRYGARAHALGWDLSPPVPALFLHVDEFTALSDRHAICTRSTRGLQRHLANLQDPWSTPEWLISVEAWVRQTLSETATVSQIRIGSAGTVLKINTHREIYYLKTVPHPLAREVALLQLLNETLPWACAEIIPGRPNDETHITRAIQGTQLCAAADQDSWNCAIQGVAELQLGSIALVEAMRSFGIPYRDLEGLYRDLRRGVVELLNAQQGSPCELEPEEVDGLDSLIHSASRDCEILSKCSLPETLINTDLNSSNIFIDQNGRTTLIDWTFARISHPFFTLHGTLYGLDGTDRCTRVDRDILAQQYLAYWRKFTNLTTLVRGFRAASRLVFVQVALNILELAKTFEDIGPPAFASVLRESLRAYNLGGD